MSFELTSEIAESDVAQMFLDWGTSMCKRLLSELDA